MRSGKAWLGAACALLLAACGGSGSGGGGGLGLSGAPGSSSAAAASANGKIETPLLAPAAEPELSGISAAVVDSSRDQTRPAIDTARLAGTSGNTYRVYATNGMELSLSLDFDNHTFEMAGADEATARGTFTEDAAEPGAYLFNSPRITGAANTARFRVTTDAIVGAFPFSKANVTPVIYAVQPFVAARTFVADAAQLDGTYNRFGVSHIGSAADSLGHQIRIHDGGTMLQFCTAALGGILSTCPANMLFDYPLIAGADGSWRVANSGSAEEAVAFRMARINGQNVYLAAGAPPGTTGRRVMKIALPDVPSNGQSLVARGAATDGSDGKIAMSEPISSSIYSIYSTSHVLPDATTNGFAYQGYTMVGTAALRVLNPRGKDRYLGMRSNTLVAATSVPATWGSGARGYLQIGLIGAPQASDPRNATYTLFATNGWRHTMTMDFDNRAYGISDEAFHSTAGKFAPDPSEAGSFVFDTARVASSGSTARFRTATGAIVGAFPFAVGEPASTTYAVQPFFASSMPVWGPQLAGTYNQVSLAPSGAGGALRYQQVRIQQSGTVMIACKDPTLRTLDDCPEALQATYSLTPIYNIGTSRYVNLNNASDSGQITAGQIVVQSGNSTEFHTVLASGTDALSGSPPLFSIALPDTSAWPATSARGASNFDVSADGTQILGAPWNKVTLDASQYLRASVFPDGSTKSIALAVDAPAAGAPKNMRRVSGGNYDGMVMQAGKLVVMTGKGGTTEGIVELSVRD
jgi:hypothetical protein